MDLGDVRVKAIYHYLVETISDKDIKVLNSLLRDYVVNGSFVDFEEDDDRVQGIVDELYKLLGF
jgi:hypothetical protein